MSGLYTLSPPPWPLLFMVTWIWIRWVEFSSVTYDNINISFTSIIRIWTIVFLYITKHYWSYTWSSQIKITISWIITGTFTFMISGGGGGGQENPTLSLSYISVISSNLWINWSLNPTSYVISLSASATTIINMIG